MSLPWHDPQFWVVTLFALAGLWAIVSPLLPRRDKQDLCGGCALGTAACAKKAMAEKVRLDKTRGGALRADPGL